MFIMDQINIYTFNKKSKKTQKSLDAFYASIRDFRDNRDLFSKQREELTTEDRNKMNSIVLRFSNSLIEIHNFNPYIARNVMMENKDIIYVLIAYLTGIYADDIFYTSLIHSLKKD